MGLRNGHLRPLRPLRRRPLAVIAMLEDAVTGMQARATVLAGKHRDHTPTPPSFVVVLVEEVAFLTAHHPDMTCA
jgi:hypothetical protein